MAAWLLPSQFSAERFRPRILAGLNAVLHRPASFGASSFQLLPRPRFTLENVVIEEDPAFGFEPFARIDRIECVVRWGSIWRRQIEFDRLRMSRLSLNLVRDTRREWNIETFLSQSGVTAEAARAENLPPPQPLNIEVEEARLDFKQGDLKLPFTVADLRGRLDFDPGRKRMRFDLEGNPLRTDLIYPTPGALEISGDWNAAQGLQGEISASLRMRDALLSNWIPLLTGKNYDVYGLLDADVNWQGPLNSLQIESQATIRQMHRADMPPPSDPLPIRLRYRGKYDSRRDRLVIESAEAAFAESNLHLTGTVENLRQMPDLDLVIALERTELEDWNRLVRRVWRLSESASLAGRLDGLLTVQGPPGERRYGGFITGRGARLRTPAGEFPFSTALALRLDARGARLDKVTLAVAPRCLITFEGEVLPARAAGPRGKPAEPPRFELRAEARTADLRDVSRLARALGIPHLRTTDAQGLGTAAVVIKGSAWPGEKPSLTARGEIRSARFLIPGLTEPLHVPRARFVAKDEHLVIEGLTAVIGSTVLSGRVQHSGPRANPWELDLAANSLRVEEAAAWFDALGHRPVQTLLERIPGLGSIAGRRSVATGLFNAIHARGRFSAPLVTYRTLRLRDFETALVLSGRILQLSDVSFRAGNGRGEAAVKVDLTPSPAEISGELRVSEVRLESLAPHLPPALRNVHGLLSGMAKFRTRGLSRSEMAAHLESEGSARIEEAGLGDFDPVAAFARRTGLADMQRARREVALKAASLDFTIQDRQVTVASQELEFDGARFRVNGRWAFNGPLDLVVAADLREVKRARMSAGVRRPGEVATTSLRLSGTLQKVQAAPLEPAAVASRSKVQ